MWQRVLFHNQAHLRVKNVKKCVGLNLVLSGHFCNNIPLCTYIAKVWISSFQHTKISENMQRMSH